MSDNPNGFKYTVSLSRVEDGWTVVFQEEYGWDNYVRDEDWEFDPVFIWTEGNFSCNCNRFLFFHRALGKSEEEIDAIDPDKGNEDGLYIGGCDVYPEFRLNWIRNDETQRVIYSDLTKD